jgi:pimeloyl-ACP methyl ester carboxylesterase
MRPFLALTLALVTFHALPAHGASVDGVHIHWTSHGAGPQTLILVHHLTADATSWREQIAAFSPRYRVVALDLPGHGRSGMPAAFSIELFVRAVEAVRSEAGAGRVVLLGHGASAPIVRRYALTHPERVAGLVLAEPLLLMTDRRGRSNAPPENIARQFSATAVREQTIRRQYFGEATPPALQDRILTMMLATPDHVAAEALIATERPSERGNEPVRLPVLAVYATAGATERAVKLLYPMAEYHRIPNTGHFLMMETPDTFNGVVEGFLARMTF